jgi:16S rRNA G966 N2-methylase RsmD
VQNITQRYSIFFSLISSGVEDKITFIIGDFYEEISKIKAANLVFLAPPWVKKLIKKREDLIIQKYRNSI